MAWMTGAAWLLARVCLVAMFPFSAADKVWHWKNSLAQTESDGLPGGPALLVAAIAVEGLTPICIVTGWLDRPAAVLLATWAAGRALGLDRADRVVLVFCGSKKSLASGVPMAGVLFPPAQVGLVILPLMIFHQIQLIACAVLARRWSERAD